MKKKRQRYGFTAAQSTELWDRWRKGESLNAIGREFGKPSSSVVAHVKPTGGISPVPRRRSRWALTLAEREEMSRDLVAGQSIRRIAAGLNRSASTVSREIRRNGGVTAQYIDDCQFRRRMMNKGIVLYLCAPNIAFKRTAIPQLKKRFPEEWAQIWDLTTASQSRLAPTRPRHSASDNALGLLTRHFFSFPFIHRHLSPERGEVVAFDVTLCPLADYFKDQGLPELTPYAACNLDHGAARERGVDLVRSQTIADGSEYCDFRWKFPASRFDQDVDSYAIENC